MKKPSAPRLASIILFSLLALAWAITLPRLRLDMSMASFIPQGSDRNLAELVRTIAEGELGNATVIDLSGPKDAELRDAAKSLASRLRALPTTESVRSGLEDADPESILHSLSPTTLLDASEWQEDRMRARVAAVKDELTGPFGPLVARVLPRDPLGGSVDALRMLSSLQGKALRSEDGILLGENGEHAFLFLSAKGNAFDADAQRGVLASLDHAFLETRGTSSLRMELSGASRFTVRSEAAIRGDINRISTISTLGIILLFVVFFRSLRMLLLAFVPLFTGVMLGTLGCHLVFKEIHGLTLAFGTSLLGVGIDYAEHYYAHYALTPERGPDRVMRDVWPGLLLGAITTIAGLGGIGWADFPCADQMALFSCLAILGALLATRFFVPPWMPLDYARPKFPSMLLARATKIVARLQGKARRPLAFALLAASLLGVTAFGLSRLRFSDDVSALIALDPDLVSEDARVQSRLSSNDAGRFAVIVADDEETALRSLAEAHTELTSAQTRGALDHFMPLGAFLKSAAAQQASLDAARANTGVLERVLAEEGFRVEAFSGFFSSLSDAKPKKLSELLAPAMLAPFRALSPKLGSRQAFVLPLGGVNSVEELRKLVPHANIVDERALLEDSYRHVRKRVLELVAMGLVFVLAILFFRYRLSRKAPMAFVPAILSAAATFAMLGLLGIPANFLHVVGIVLVLSMGVDYGIFLVEATDSPEESARALVSIFTATLTTVLSFGLLALSSNPALRALGITSAVGTSASFLLCPLALLVRATNSPREAEKSA